MLGLDALIILPECDLHGYAVSRRPVCQAPLLLCQGSLVSCQLGLLLLQLGLAGPQLAFPVLCHLKAIANSLDEATSSSYSSA